MKTIIYNMIRILKADQVLVLDKVKKYGWEGLTFPGGHVETEESFIESAIREAKEETNLDVRDLELNGVIQWYDLLNNERHMGLLYTTRNFSGNLISENREGNLFFQKYRDFIKNTENMSDSMPNILKIYEGKCREIIMYYEGSRFLYEKEF